MRRLGLFGDRSKSYITPGMRQLSYLSGLHSRATDNPHPFEQIALRSGEELSEMANELGLNHQLPMHNQLAYSMTLLSPKHFTAFKLISEMIEFSNMK
jgi:hypothetical protein